eukprot:gene33965-41893_t
MRSYCNPPTYLSKLLRKWWSQWLLNNPRVLKYLTGTLGADEDAKTTWYRHWVRQGLEAFERQLVLLATERAAAGLTPSVYCWGDAQQRAVLAKLPQAQVVFNYL